MPLAYVKPSVHPSGIPGGSAADTVDTIINKAASTASRRAFIPSNRVCFLMSLWLVDIFLMAIGTRQVADVALMKLLPTYRTLT